MIGDPRISVIMPARNAQSTIELAIQSLLSQSIAEWEVIVVDDASTDGTSALVSGIAQAEPRIRLVSGPGEGVAGARNRGIALARGQWLALLDADDWLDPEFMAKMLSALEAAPGYRIAYCHYLRVMPDGTTIHEYPDSHVHSDPCEVFSRFCGVSTNSVLLDRQMVVAAGGFDSALATCEDWDLWQRLSRAGEGWLPVDEPLAFYRATAGSLSRDTRQLLADGRTVIYRAFSPDPRVTNPPPARAQRIPDNCGPGVEESYARFALWTCVIAAIEGPADLSLPHEVRHLSHGPQDGQSIADTFIHALSIALRKAPDQLAACWPRFAGAVDRVISQLGKVWADPVAERRLRYSLDHRLLEYDDLAEPRHLGLTIGLRVPLHAPPPVTPDGGRDAIYAYVENEDEIAAVLDRGILGTLGDAAWAERLTFPSSDPNSIGSRIGALARPVAIEQIRAMHGAASPPRSLTQKLTCQLFEGLRPSSRSHRKSMAEGEALLECRRELYPRGSHHEALARIAISARAEALGLTSPARPPLRARQPAPVSRVADERRDYIPVLRLPPVATAAPATPCRDRLTLAQLSERLRWLRDNGYHTLTAEEVGWHLRHGAPFVGRPVWLTSDNPSREFAERTWPELQTVNMTADVFVSTDAIEIRALRSASADGDPPPMDADLMAQLASEGLFFGSLLATQRAADGLSTEQLAGEMLRSRALIERWIGWQPVAVAAPFGITDRRFGALAEECGYDLAVCGDSGLTRIGGSPFSISRFDVRGDQPMEDFVSMMEQLQ